MSEALPFPETWHRRQVLPLRAFGPHAHRTCSAAACCLCSRWVRHDAVKTTAGRQLHEAYAGQETPIRAAVYSRTVADRLPPRMHRRHAASVSCAISIDSPCCRFRPDNRQLATVTPSRLFGTCRMSSAGAGVCVRISRLCATLGDGFGKSQGRLFCWCFCCRFCRHSGRCRVKCNTLVVGQAGAEQRPTKLPLWWVYA
jgi:hypothetical protein